MSDDPWIGDPSSDQGSGACAFSPNPGDPKCGAPATLHLLSESAIYGLVGLPTCGTHAPLARSAGLFLGEHPFEDACKAHLAWWRVDGCGPADESGAAS